MATTTADPSRTSNDVRSPSVLVVLVTRDAAGWLRGCLESLAAQTHPRLGVMAIDNGSTDGTIDLLHQALGEGRVVALGQNRGLAAALAAATELPPPRPPTTSYWFRRRRAPPRTRSSGCSRAPRASRASSAWAWSGPKIVDWDDPRILREVGRSTDRFGHPYSPCRTGKLDQGQYDRVLEVLFVSSAVMLVSREAWQRTGPSTSASRATTTTSTSAGGRVWRASGS
jgi:GT2 family glycosyltransferase